MKLQYTQVLRSGRVGIRQIARTLFIAFVLLVGEVQQCYSQYCRLFTADDALPNTLVNDIIEDSDMMIWVATEYGLCRFDGSKFTTYQSVEGDAHSLQDNYVRTLFVDSKGRLLIGTRRGLQVYRPETDDFSVLAVFEGSGGESGDINKIIERPNGEYWLSGNTPCCARIAPDGIPVLYPNSFTDQIDYTETIVEDHSGRLWVNRRMEALYRLDVDGTLSRFTQDNRNVPFDHLFPASDGVLYAGGQQPGLYRYNSVADRFERVDHADERFLICDIIDLDDSHLFLASDNEGLKVYDLRTGAISNYDFADGRIESGTQKVHAVCIDHNRVIWLALYQKGVMMVPQTPQPFKYMGVNSSTRDCIGDKCVTSIFQSSDHLIWVTTDNGGLYAIDREGHQQRHFPSPPMPCSLVRIFEDSRHRLWYGSYAQGYGWIDPKTGRMTKLSFEHKDKNSNVYDFSEDQNGRVWIATMGSGLYYFDERLRTGLQPFRSDSCHWISCLYFNPMRHKLYAGSFTGLTEIDTDDLSQQPKQFLGKYIIFAITPYTSGRLALCTTQGLIIFDINSRQYSRYTTADGLPSNLLYAAQCDAGGLLWISSNAGISCFNEKRGTFTNYTVHDGLQSNEFYKNVSMRDDSGCFWFGGTAGITCFDPREVDLEGKKCDVRIVGITAGSRYVRERQRKEFDDNSLSFEMATLPIDQTRHAVYSYSLDKDPWVSLPQGHNQVSFSHIAPGRHVFRYRATLAGIGSEVKTYAFSISYPWYRQWYVISIIVLLLVVIACMGVLQIRHRRAVRAKLARHVQTQAINEAKLQMFMNIAHEIRTPMTMIVSPLQKLIASDPDQDRQHSYHTMERNADRIVGLVNQLMDLRKLDKKQIRLYCSEIDIVPYVREVCDSMTDVADVRGVKLSLASHVDDGLKLWVDTTNFDKILINLLSNAFKYTPHEGRVEVALSQDTPTERYPEGCFVMTVTDTGEGIPDDEKPRVFERFYQVRSTSSGKSGTGIGLHLTASLVKLHHGTIEVKDNPDGPGTRFVVVLPLGHAHLKPSEMSDRTVTAQTVVHPEVLQVNPEVFVDDSEPHAASPQCQHTVVLAEDDDEIRHYVTQELSAYCRVVECRDGREAYDYIIHHTPDLLISDVMMPVMDGFELCRKIRSNVRLNHIPVILLTAKSDEDSRLESLDLGADAFMTKPFSIEVLRKTVKNLLESRTRLRNTYRGQQMPVGQVQVPEAKSPDERLMARIMKVVNQNLSNPNLTTEMIAGEVGMSRVHLYRKLKELTNQSARDFIRNIRLTKAAELLSQKKVSVSEVADMVGFSNAGNFATAFKELYGTTPTAYMDEHLAKDNKTEEHEQESQQ